MNRALLNKPHDDGDEPPGSPFSAPRLRDHYARCVAAVLEGEREAARASADQAARIERMRLAALAVAFADRSAGGPKWSDEVVVQRTAVTELAVGARLSEADARRKIDTAAGLCKAFAETRAALEVGDISYRHAEKIVRHGQLLPEQCIADYEARLVPIAERVTVQRLEREARAAAEEAQPRSSVQRHLAAVLERRLYLDPAADGMAYLTMFLPAVEAVAVFSRATDIAKSLKNAGDPRTLTQLRVDAIADLALNSETSIPGASRGIRPHVRITVPALALLAPAGSRGGRSGDTRDVRPRTESPIPSPIDGCDRASEGSRGAGAAVLEGFGPIDMLTALKLTRDAPGFYRVLTDPATGIALSYGRQRYKPPADLDQLIRAVHQECTFPLSCTPSATADLDHTRDFAFGSSTEFDNLAPLCSSHHKVKHHTEWKVEQHPAVAGIAGVITWTSPAGFEYTVEPTPIARPVTPQFIDALAHMPHPPHPPHIATSAHDDHTSELGDCMF